MSVNYLRLRTEISPNQGILFKYNAQSQLKDGEILVFSLLLVQL